MLALIAGTGDLPGAIVAALRAAGRPDPLICEMPGFVADLPPDLPRLPFRIEQLGGFLAAARARGVTEFCLAGAVRRPKIDPAAIDPLTMPLVPRIRDAMAMGDDGALREMIAIFEEQGFVLRSAQEIAPDLLPAEGVLTRVAPTDAHRADAEVARAAIAEMGATDLGQACVVVQGRVTAREADDGTDAMLARLCPETKADPMPLDLIEVGIQQVGAVVNPTGHRPDPAGGGMFWKAPKPQQDRRADLPTIGPRTAMLAAEAGLDGLAIEAGGVLVLDLPQVLAILDGQGMFLWVAPR